MISAVLAMLEGTGVFVVRVLDEGEVFPVALDLRTEHRVGGAWPRRESARDPGAQGGGDDRGRAAIVPRGNIHSLEGGAAWKRTV